MKILLVTDTYLPVISGSTLIVQRIATELSKKGHEVAVLCMGTKFQSSSEKTTQQTVLYNSRSIRNPLRNDHFIPLVLPWEVKNIINTVNPDVIHSHTLGPLGFWTMIYANKFRVKHIASCYGIPSYATSYLSFLSKNISNFVEKVIWIYYKWFYNNISIITVLSAYPKRELRAHHINSRIYIIPMWVDNSQLSPSNRGSALVRLGIAENKKVFLYLGRLDMDKNLKVLVDAFNILTEKNEVLLGKFHLIIAGDGKEKKSLENLVFEKRLTNNVTFVGVVDPTLVHKIYAISDIFIMPGPYETQSIATVHAISYGLFALVANNGALPEIKKRFPRNCETFNTFDAGSLANKIKWILDKPPVKKYSPGKFTPYYSKESVMTQLETVYKSFRKNY